MKRSSFALVTCFAVALPLAAQIGVGGLPQQQPAPLVVTVTPWGPDQAALDATKAMVTAHPAVARYLTGTRNRLLYLELVDSLKEGQPPDRFRVTFWDYTHNMAVIASGTINDATSVTVATTRRQQDPSNDEYDEAVSILRNDPYFGPLLAKGDLVAYQPMPPVVQTTPFDLENDRIVTVGLFPPRGTARNEIAGANLTTGTVVRFPGGAPPSALANEGSCGIPPAGQQTTPRGTAGEYQLVVTQNGATIWAMHIIRPSVSSGTSGSAIELRDVEYVGKRVFKRAHVPILNVQYVNNACGPYRDWQYQEGMFQADGTDVAPGIRACTTMPQTILDNGTDTGNFRGVAYFVTATELVMKTEMEAGWYRYVHEWHFDVNGTIRPRFAFGATSSSCVCNTHTHHAYYRLDFDINDPGKNVIWEVNGRGTPIKRTTEMMSLRSPTWNRRWIVQNAGTGHYYEIRPNPIDGLADVFGRGDLWLLQYHAGVEIDDGRTIGSGPAEINIDPFVNGESIDRQDVVVWYGTHSIHIGGELDEDFVGPDLVPVSW